MDDPLVMLPGMMCDRRLFAPQRQAFEHNHQIIIPDLHGTDDITALVRMLMPLLPQRFALAGLSMGGIIAMEIYRLHPNRVSRLALMDTNPFAETAERQMIRKSQLQRLAAGGLREIMQHEMKPHYLAATAQQSQILELCMTMALDLGDDVFIQQSRMLAGRRDQTSTLRAINVPTLILYGEEDRLCPEQRHLAMADLIDGAKLVKIKKAGHLPRLEQPAETNIALSRWLEEA